MLYFALSVKIGFEKSKEQEQLYRTSSNCLCILRDKGQAKSTDLLSRRRI